jgi:hypothetical protein
VEAEMPGSASSLGTLVRQLAEDIGDSPTGRMRLRWRIRLDDLAEAREDQAAEPRVQSTRDRMLRAVDGI